jgi:hypothetical protein
MRRAILPIIFLPAGLTALVSTAAAGIKPSSRVLGLVLTGSALLSSIGLLYLLWHEDRRLKAQIQVLQGKLGPLAGPLKNRNRVTH